MTKAQGLLLAGIDAFKQKDFVRAEDLLLAAYQAYPATDDARRTACVHLGMIYRKTERYDDAIRLLELALPRPAAFEELVKMYRAFAKEVKKAGDLNDCAEWYRRMYSLARIQATVLTLRMPHQPVAVDWDRAAHWLEDIRRQCGTLYAFQFDGQKIAGDKLLSEADYKGMGA